MRSTQKRVHVPMLVLMKLWRVLTSRMTCGAQRVGSTRSVVDLSHKRFSRASLQRFTISATGVGDDGTFWASGTGQSIRPERD